MKRGSIALVLMALSACSSTTTQASCGTGELQFQIDESGSCSGKFRYDAGQTTGTGRFICDNGKQGSFRFTNTGAGAQAVGKTDDGDEFEFAFGGSSVATD